MRKSEMIKSGGWSTDLSNASAPSLEEMTEQCDSMPRHMRSRIMVLSRINDNAYVIDIPQSKYLVSNTFNVADLSPYHGENEDLESRTTLSQGGGDDVAQPTVVTPPRPTSPPSGPMTRSRAKAIHDKVNSFLSMCDIDPTLDGTLPHANALCILRYEPHGGRQVDTEEDGGSQREGREETGPTGSEPASRSPSRTRPAGANR